MSIKRGHLEQIRLEVNHNQCSKGLDTKIKFKNRNFSNGFTKLHGIYIILAYTYKNIE